MVVDLPDTPKLVELSSNYESMEEYREEDLEEDPEEDLKLREPWVNHRVNNA